MRAGYTSPILVPIHPVLLSGKDQNKTTTYSRERKTLTGQNQI